MNDKSNKKRQREYVSDKFAKLSINQPDKKKQKTLSAKARHLVQQTLNNVVAKKQRDQLFEYEKLQYAGVKRAIQVYSTGFSHFGRRPVVDKNKRSMVFLESEPEKLNRYPNAAWVFLVPVKKDSDSDSDSENGIQGILNSLATLPKLERVYIDTNQVDFEDKSYEYKKSVANSLHNLVTGKGCDVIFYSPDHTTPTDPSFLDAISQAYDATSVIKTYPADLLISILGFL